MLPQSPAKRALRARCPPQTSCGACILTPCRNAQRASLPSRPLRARHRRLPAHRASGTHFRTGKEDQAKMPRSNARSPRRRYGRGRGRASRWAYGMGAALCVPSLRSTGTGQGEGKSRSQSPKTLWTIPPAHQARKQGVPSAPSSHCATQALPHARKEGLSLRIPITVRIQSLIPAPFPGSWAEWEAGGSGNSRSPPAAARL